MGLYIPDPDFDANMQDALGPQAALRSAAEAVRGRAESDTPRIMPRNPQAFEIQADAEGVRLVNTDHGGHLAEWGSANNPPMAPLRRAVRSAGLRLEEQERA